MQRFYGDQPHILEKRRARTSKKSKCAPQRKRSGVKFAAILSALSVLVLFCVVFGSSRTTTVTRVKNKEWYFVGIFTSSDSGQASIKALDIRTRGGAGFIYNDGNYSVIASVYPTEREAKTVAEKQPDPATVIKVEFCEMKFSSEELNDSILSAFSLPTAVVAELNETAQSYEKGNLTESEVAYRIDTIGARARELTYAIEQNTSRAATCAEKILAAITSAADEADDDASAVLSSRLRFCACEIVDKVAELSAVYSALRLP